MRRQPWSVRLYQVGHRLLRRARLRRALDYHFSRGSRRFACGQNRRRGPSEAQRRLGAMGPPSRREHKRDARRTGPALLQPWPGRRAGARAHNCSILASGQPGLAPSPWDKEALWLGEVRAAQAAWLAELEPERAREFPPRWAEGLRCFAACHSGAGLPGIEARPPSE